MKANALYFPYIRVPESAWFTRTLLYWDQVATIVPYEFIAEPERLGEHTRSLVEHELVAQVQPGLYNWDLPSFASAFAAYLAESPERLVERQEAFRRGETFRIHIEKMDPLAGVLHEAGLCAEQEYPWTSVEQATATDFMAYLAASLGQVEEIDAIPVSDHEKSLAPLLSPHGGAAPPDRELDELRVVVLEELFPAPERPLAAAEIAEFRSKHGDELRGFRRRVEREILALAELEDAGRRERRLELFRDEIGETVEEIRARLEEAGAGRTVLSKLWSVVLAVPGVPPALGLLNAVCKVFEKAKEEPRSFPLAYAARAQLGLLGGGGA